ncbi:MULTISPECIES: hypothetical protein [unclassified Microcoleus]|uniref:hypothetical protein n=1 Tax=unclassified Microcoleus TaxID=2642155 RepID=UPI002FD6DA0E
MSPQEQNRLETATATVADGGAALATKTQLCLKPISFRFGRFYQVDARHRVNASDWRCLLFPSAIPRLGHFHLLPLPHCGIMSNL